MKVRWLTLLVWALVAASATYWALKLFVRAPPAPPAGVVAPHAALRGDLVRLLGEDPEAPDEPGEAPAAESSRFQLVGVVAARGAAGASQGVALIAVDGLAARAFKVGAVVDGNTVLQAVQVRAASLGPRGGAAEVSLELPVLPPPATGNLPAAVNSMGAPAAAPPPRPGLPLSGLPLPGVRRGANNLLPTARGGFPGQPQRPTAAFPGQPQPGVQAEPAEENDGPADTVPSR